MKDSGIEWIGEIPEEWKVIHNKYLLTKHKELIEKYNDENILSLTLNGVIIRNLNDGGKMPSSFVGYQKLYKGNLLLCLFDIDVTPRCVGLIKSDGITSPAYSQYEVNSKVADVRYYYYYFLMLDNKKVLVHMGKSLRSSISNDQFGNINSILPPKSQQIEIADYLDKKVFEINQASQTIQQEIDALEEYRKSLITETVTKGLDKTVSMKDSGIEWIGEIPENWKVEPVYLHFKERKNKNAKGKEKNLLSLSYGNIIEKDITQLGGLLPSSYTIYNVVEPGDIIIRPTDLQNDKKSFRTGLVTEHGIITSAYIDLMPCNKQSSKFFHYLLHSYDIQKVFYNMGNGVRQGLNFAEFSKLRLLVPGKEEQSKIARFLDQKCFRIAKVITQKQRQLDYFNKYKQSIIYEYVTGKKQVPEKEGIKNAQ